MERKKWLKDTQRSMAVAIMCRVLNSSLVTCRRIGLTFLWIAHWYWLKFLRCKSCHEVKRLKYLLSNWIQFCDFFFLLMPARRALQTRKGQLASQLLKLGMEFQQLAKVKKVKSSYSGPERPAVALEILI